MKEEEIIKKSGKVADDRIVFTVENGYRKIREEKVKFKGNNLKNVILIDDVPLVILSEERSPMCAAIIKIGQGREYVDTNINSKINVNKEVHELNDGFEALRPILELLEDGEYELVERDMIPTDGENNYFWDYSISGRYYNASADVYYRGNYIKGFAKFLVPSEGIDRINMEKVNYYRQKIRKGEEVCGIALELRGFMALLLDGHHKATAAYLEGKTLRCLVIKNIKKNTKIVNFNKENYRISSAKSHIGNIKIKAPNDAFPDFTAIAVVNKPIDISNLRINNLFKFNSRQPLEDLKEILYYLSIYDKEKAKELCFKILKKRDLQLIWGTCFEYLSRYNDESVKQLFEEILLDKDIKNTFNYDVNFNLINSYMDKEAN